jgi:hypothetical protein
MSKPRRRTWREAELREAIRVGLPYDRSDYVVYEDTIKRGTRIEIESVVTNIGHYLDNILKRRGRA